MAFAGDSKTPEPKPLTSVASSRIAFIHNTPEIVNGRPRELAGRGKQPLQTKRSVVPANAGDPYAVPSIVRVVLVALLCGRATQ